MSLYLGKNLISGNEIIVGKQSGTVTSDSESVITFPEFDFEPELIILHDTSFSTGVDAETISNQNLDPNNDYSNVLTGTFIMAKKINGTWVVQIPNGWSGVIDSSSISNSIIPWLGTPALAYDSELKVYKWYLLGYTNVDDTLVPATPENLPGSFPLDKFLNVNFHFEVFGSLQ